MSQGQSESQVEPGKSVGAGIWSAVVASRRTPWVIGIVAVAVRLLHMSLIRSSTLAEVLMSDAESYDAWARQLAAGNWLDRGVFYQSPLYPHLMGLVYFLTGADAHHVRLLQALVGGASCVLLAKAGESFFNRATGVVAAALLAVHPTAVFFDGLIQKSSLDIFFACLLVFAMGRLLTRPTPGKWLLSGVSAGALMLNRENAIVVVPALFAWLVARQWRAGAGEASGTSEEWRAVWARAGVRVGVAGAMVALGLVLVLGPVVARNWWASGGFYLTTSQFGPNFYIATKPGTGGLYVPLKWGRSTPRHERQDATDIAEEAQGRKLTPAEVSAYWRERGMRNIREHPGEWVGLLWRKWWLFWNHVEIGDTEDQYTWSEESWVIRWPEPMLHMGVIFPLAAAGLVVTRRDWRKWWGLAWVAGIYTASVVLFFVFSRFRHPMLPIFLLFAAAALAHPWLSEIRERRWLRVVPALAAAAVVSWVSNLELLPVETTVAITHMNLGGYLAERGQYDAARKHMVRAIEVKPDLPEAYYNLGGLDLTQGRFRESAENFGRSLQLDPTSDAAKVGLRTALLALQSNQTPASAPATRK